MSEDSSMDGQQFDVIVIGSGVAGAMAAIGTSRVGLQTLLVERNSFPRHKVCGCCLNGRAIQILKQAELGAAFLALQPTRTSSLSVRCGGRRLDVETPSSLAVSRRALDQWLVKEAVLAGCRFVDNTTATVLPMSDETHDAQNRVVEIRRTTSRDSSSADVDSAESDGMPTQRVSAKVVLVCDGLGHPSLNRLPEYHAAAKPGSRIGLGAIFPRMDDDDWIRPGEVLMAVAPHGYAGVAEIEHRQWNLAAAVDPSHLSQTHSPLATLESLFKTAGVPAPQALSGATFKGTVPLTRTANRIAGQRLFLLGDSTGYIEPFTGEGMAWALTAATAVVPIAAQAVRRGWSDDLIAQWQAVFRSSVRREQNICRMLSAALKRPWMLPPILSTCRMFPSLTQRLVRQINRVPEVLEIL
jgi:flavin-dependent dehydrogenase